MNRIPLVVNLFWGCSPYFKNVKEKCRSWRGLNPDLQLRGIFPSLCLVASIWKNQEVSLACHKWDNSHFYIQQTLSRGDGDDAGSWGGGEDWSWFGSLCLSEHAHCSRCFCSLCWAQVSSCSGLRWCCGRQGCWISHNAMLFLPRACLWFPVTAWALPGLPQQLLHLFCAPRVPPAAWHGAVPPVAVLLVLVLIFGAVTSTACTELRLSHGIMAQCWDPARWDLPPAMHSSLEELWDKGGDTLCAFFFYEWDFWNTEFLSIVFESLAVS